MATIWSKRPPLDLPKNRLIDTSIEEPVEPIRGDPLAIETSRRSLGDMEKMHADRQATDLLTRCLPTMARLVALVILGTALASCSGGIVADYRLIGPAAMRKTRRRDQARRNTPHLDRNKRRRQHGIKSKDRDLLPVDAPDFG